MDMLTTADIGERKLRSEAVFGEDYAFECHVSQDFEYDDLHCSPAAPVEPTACLRMALVKCIGNYVKEFSRHRGITVAGLRVEATFISDTYSVKEIDRIEIKVTLPEAFPVKYKRAINSLISQCRIVSLLSDPPDVNWGLESTAPPASALE